MHRPSGVSEHYAATFATGAPFDINDDLAYYFGSMNRDQVREHLLDAPIGTFLIRDSTQDLGQKVLCVK